MQTRADALEFITVSTLTKTITADFHRKTIIFTSTCIVTVPSGLPLGFECTLLPTSGVLTVNFPATATLNGSVGGSQVLLSTNYQTAQLAVIGSGNFICSTTASFSRVAGNQSSGSITFKDNPTDNQTIVLNGTTVTFKTSPGAFPETQIESTLAETIDTLVTNLTADTSAALARSSYSRYSNRLNIVSKGAGESGDAFTLGEGTAAVTVSNTSLVGGIEANPTPGIRLISSGTEDVITAEDNNKILLYAPSGDTTVTFRSDIGVGFKCYAIRHPSAPLVTFDSGACQSVNDMFTLRPAGTVTISCPDAATMYLSGDLERTDLTVAALPSNPSIGDVMMVTDADSAVAGTSILGGSNKKSLVWWDGSAWRALCGHG